jgi:hypothetical protein
MKFLWSKRKCFLFIALIIILAFSLKEYKSLRTLTLQQQLSTKNETTKQEEVLCIHDEPFGRTFNQVLTIAAARTIASEYSNDKDYVIVKVGLGPNFSTMYEEFLEPQEDIKLHYQVNCTYKYAAYELFGMFFTNSWSNKVPFIQTLIPKASVRADAETALASFPIQPVTTVHRRHLEDTCLQNTQNPDNIACLDSLEGNRKKISEYMSVSLLIYVI